MNKFKKEAARSIVLLAVLTILFMVLIGRLFFLQIVNGEKYTEKFNLRIKREITLPGTRGNIYDRNGKPLAVNKLAWSVTIEDQGSYASERERELDLNGKIYQLITLLEKHGDSMENALQIRLDKNGNYEFTADGFQLDRFKADVYGRSQIEDLTEEEQAADAEDVVAYLADKFCVYSQADKEYTEKEREAYGLPEEFQKKEVLDIVSMRYALFLQTYQKYLSVTAARDVSPETAAAVMESDLSGVDVREGSIRVYEGGEACAPVLGYTGPVSAEDLEESEEKGYTVNSIVGKSGMEEYLEDVLQGRDGKKEVYVDNMGRVTQDLGVTEEVRAGKDVYLTIDLELQQKTYEALERKIADILLANIINAKTFDKTAVKDAVEIKIPVYDVYIALLNNGLIDVSHFEETDASGTEQEVYRIFTEGKDQVLREIQAVLEDSAARYADLTAEMQEYTDFIIDSLDLIDHDRLEEESETYQRWTEGDLSLKEFLYQAIEEGWINFEALDSGEEYLTRDEMYEMLCTYIRQELQDHATFDELIYKYLVLEDKILPEQICMILYDQGAADKADGDFESWQHGGISTHELVLRKIDKLEITPADLALDPCSGSAVVTDTKTGEVLACVSYPGYDNNRLAGQMDEEYYYRIYNNASLPLYNRATQQLSAPGSTFKPVTVIAGMEEGVINAGTAVVCDGVFDKVAPPLKCWHEAGHGSVSDAASALQNSCNDYLCEISYRLGMGEGGTYSDEQALDVLQEYARLFDLDKKSGIELPESSPQVTDSYAIPSAIGQGTNNFSTVQLARYATTLGNRGTSFALTLIDQIDGAENEPEIESQIDLAPEVWDTVHIGMEWYIQSTQIFNDFPITAAGKSGTAQEIKTRPDHSLFIGFAPADVPEIAAAVRITNGYEAGNAVACGREIFETYYTLKGELYEKNE